MNNGPQISAKFNVPRNLKSGIKRAPKLFDEELNAFIYEADLLLEREVKELTPVGIGAGGGLRGSIAGQEPKRLADRIIGEVSTTLSHAIPVELGTKPHMPPVQPLVDWAAQKFGLPEDEAKRVGFLVARKIATKGTKGHFMFEKAFDANENQVTSMLQDRMDGFLDKIGGRA